MALEWANVAVAATRGGVRDLAPESRLSGVAATRSG